MQKCDPKKIEVVIEELKSFQAEVALAEGERQKRMDAMAKELCIEMDAEKMKLATFVAKYKKVSTDVEAAVKHCIATIEEVTHNPALGYGAKFQVDKCTDDFNLPCPPVPLNEGEKAIQKVKRLNKK